MSPGRRCRRGAAAVVVALALGATPAAASLPAGSYTITPKPLSFGHVTIGGNRTADAVVTNTSPDLTLGFVASGVTPDSPSDAFSEVTNEPFANECYTEYFGAHVLVLQPGDTCYLRYRFAPAAPSGGKTATAHVSVYLGSTLSPPFFTPDPSTKPAATTTFTLKGTADPLKYTVDPDPVDFGHLTTSAHSTKTLVVTNNSDVQIQYTASAIAPANAQFHHDDTGLFLPCLESGEDGIERALVVPPGGNCQMAFTFDPTTNGAKTAAVKVQAFGLASPVDTSHYQYLGHAPRPVVSTTVHLRGTADPPRWQIGPTTRKLPVDFGTQTVHSITVQHVTVHNLSDILLDFAGSLSDIKPANAFVDVPGSIPDDGSPLCWGLEGAPNSAPYALPVPPHSSCEFTYLFVPPSVGSFTATATIWAYRSSPQGPFVAPDDLSGKAPFGHNTLTLKGKGFAG